MSVDANKDLCSASHAGDPGVRFAGSKLRRVDYSIGVDVLESHDETELHQTLTHSRGLVSQSDHPLVSKKVLCSHVEIKANFNPNKAHVQLKIWASAIFKKQHHLRTLCTTADMDQIERDNVSFCLIRTVSISMKSKMTIQLKKSLRLSARHIIRTKPITRLTQDLCPMTPEQRKYAQSLWDQIGIIYAPAIMLGRSA